MKRFLFCSRSNCAVLSLIIALSFSPNAQAQLQYRVEYGNLPVGTTYLLVNRLVEVSDGTNTTKVVTGFYQLNGGPNRGFIYDHTTGVFTDVHSLLAIDESLLSSVPTINSNGIAVGYVSAGVGNRRVFWFDYLSIVPTLNFLDQQFPELAPELAEASFEPRGITSDGDILVRRTTGGPPYYHFVANPFSNGGSGELILLDMFFDVSGINDSRAILGVNTLNNAVTYDAVGDVTATFEEIEIFTGSKEKINNFGEFCGNTYVVTSGHGKRNETKRYAARHDGTQVTWTSNPIEVSLAGARSINDDGDVLFLTYVAGDIAWFHHSSLGQSFEVKTLVDDPFFNSANVAFAYLTNRDNSLTVPAPTINGRATGANGDYRLYFLFPEEPGSTAGISITPTIGLTTTEAGGQAIFDVVLDSAPAADVTIGINSSNPAEGTVDQASLTFTPANWDTLQTVTITGVDDAIDDGDVAYTIFTAAAVSTDPAYNGLNAADVGVTNLDNDGPLVYSSTDTPLNIPDNNSTGISSTINVGDNFTIANLTVTLSIDHQRPSDLNVFLTGPNNASVQLFNFTGDNNVTNFNGIGTDGPWTVKVVDHVRKKTGTLNSWSMTVQTN